MIIKHFDFEPFLIDSRFLRKGLLIHLKGNNGRETTVEASPLPDWSRETFQEAKEQLIQIQSTIQSIEWSKSTLDLLFRMRLFSSVHFALEIGILDLIDPVEDKKTVQTYTLLSGTFETIEKEANTLEQKGKREIKIKLGHLTFEEACQLIDPLIGRFVIRLDFNRKWPKKATLNFCQRYDQDAFFYIEEPCQHPNELSDFPYPFALDETLRDTDDPSLLSAPMLKKLILKPTISYRLTPFLESKIPCVVTSSFESPTGIAQLERLIKRLNLIETTHGLNSLPQANPIT